MNVEADPWLSRTVSIGLHLCSNHKEGGRDGAVHPPSPDSLVPQVDPPECLVVAVEIHEGVHLNVLDEVARDVKLLKMHIDLCGLRCNKVFDVAGWHLHDIVFQFHDRCSSGTAMAHSPASPRVTF